MKADGLASGKGVTICQNKNQVFAVSNEIFNDEFKSSSKLVLEEFLSGEEASYFLIVDKYNFKFLVLLKTINGLEKRQRSKHWG